MNEKQKANQLISEKLEKIQKMFNECKEIAKEHELRFNFIMPGYEEAGFNLDFRIEDCFRYEEFLEELKEQLKNNEIDEKQYFEKIEDKKKRFRGMVRLKNSSLSCAMSYVSEIKYFEGE